MKPVINVRRASGEDVPTLLRLIQSLADYEHLEGPSPEARDRFVEHGFGDHPFYEAYLVWMDEQPVGYAIAFYTYSTFLAQPTLYLEDLFVLPEARGQGAGYALFRLLAREAMDRGCGRIEWCVLDWNNLAIEFYDRLGGKCLSDWKHYRLDRDGIERLAAGTERAFSEPWRDRSSDR